MMTRILKETMSITWMVTAFLLAVISCKPVNDKSGSSQGNELSPCYVIDKEHATGNVTDVNVSNIEDRLSALTARSQALQYQIETSKAMIIKDFNTQVIKQCVTSRLPEHNISISCVNTSFTTKHGAIECMVSSYQILQQFSSSIKLLKNKDFPSKKNLHDIFNTLNTLQADTDQILCELQIDLGSLGYDISRIPKTPERELIIVIDFTKLTEKKYTKECYNDDKLNQLQILHGIYQFLDTFSNVTKDMGRLFSEQYLLESKNDGTSNRTEDLSTTMKTTFVIDLKKLMLGRK